jgi:hypothetical protein
MHRTQANGFETIGGKTLFQDTQPLGTLAEADDFNASQEEICQAVEAAGITLNTQAQDFGTGDFVDARQLADAIAETASDFKFKTTSILFKGGTDLSPAIDLKYVRHALNKLITTSWLSHNLVLTAPASIIIMRGAGDVSLPSFLDPEHTQEISGHVSIAGVLIPVIFQINVGDVSIFRADGVATFPASTVNVRPCTLTYLANDPIP